MAILAMVALVGMIICQIFVAIKIFQADGALERNSGSALRSLRSHLGLDERVQAQHQKHHDDLDSADYCLHDPGRNGRGIQLQSRHATNRYSVGTEMRRRNALRIRRRTPRPTAV